MGVVDPAKLSIPKSLAIIMDGNGRWALKRGLPRSMGHREGARALENLIPEVGRLGIKYVTVYAFSTENWKRSSDEVDSLMQLFKAYVPRLLSQAMSHNVRVRFIGDRNRFRQDITDLMFGLEEKTLGNTGLNFIIAANYGGRDEIRRAALSFALDCASKSNTLGHEDSCGKNSPSSPEILNGTDPQTEIKLSETMFSSYLDTAGIPDPDLLIRTSGEKRLSNFLLWQLAYSEIVVTDCLWPDFDRLTLIKCIEEYSRRKRKFGGV